MRSSPSEAAPHDRLASHLVLIGARSRAGHAILRAWPGSGVTQIHRGEGHGVTVADYTDVPNGMIPPDSVVVNCVGTPTGSEAALFRLNRDVPVRWAEAAAAAGAKHFIQLSSFSVYGRAERIDRDTPEAPVTAYGRSKLAGDRALLAIDRAGMMVTSLRIPMLFGTGDDKLARLVKAVLKMGAVPLVSPPIERAMLSYDALGAAVAQSARPSASGIANIADPTAFTYELLCDRITQATGRRLRRIRIPAIAAAATRLLAPPLHTRLLASSRLAPEVALSFKMPAEASLEREIDRLARAQMHEADR